MRRISYMSVLLVILLVFGCKKDPTGFNNQIYLEADLLAEKTTHVFNFKVKTKEPISSRQKIYCRYDWEGDGVWDTPYTEDVDINHRYYVPGDYTVKTEFLTKSGFSDTDSLNISVARGYSNPRAAFLVSPRTGHFKTEFTFEASLTADDEDSLKDLRFQWDIFDDGKFETQSQSSTEMKYVFNKTGHFPVKLIVQDPSERFGSFVQYVTIHDTDTLIRPVVKISPEVASVVDTIKFDASASYHDSIGNHGFTYSWLFPYELPTIPSEDSAIVYRSFERPGPKKCQLIITDKDGLKNSWEIEIYVSLGNRPPTALIEVPSQYGNVSTQFYFRAWGSKDDHIGGSELKKRWDFDGDGIWDTNYSKEMEIYHQFIKAGTYNPTLEVMDNEGLTGTYSVQIQISPYTNPTGFIVDSRDNKMYATVKVGNYWWMSENLDWRPDKKMKMPMLQKCYNEDSKYCDMYGSLYLVPYLRDYLQSGKNICPNGWHVPTKTEMDDLKTSMPDIDSRGALLPGGSMDFNAVYGGRGSYTFDRDMFDNITDTIYSFENVGYEGIISSTARKGVDQILNLQYSTSTSEAWIFWYPANQNYYSIRCVKD